MKCKKCGNEIKDGKKFCSKCGTKVDINQQNTIISDIIYTRYKTNYATDKINKEIQDIADRLTESTNGTYQWLKFNLTRDMKSIDMYFEIVE